MVGIFIFKGDSHGLQQIHGTWTEQLPRGSGIHFLGTIFGSKHESDEGYSSYLLLSFLCNFDPVVQSMGSLLCARYSCYNDR
jgi:hypothetical protein